MAQSKAQLAGYLEGLQRNQASLTRQLAAAIDGSTEKATLLVHQAGLTKAIADTQAALKALDTPAPNEPAAAPGEPPGH